MSSSPSCAELILDRDTLVGKAFFANSQELLDVWGTWTVRVIFQLIRDVEPYIFLITRARLLAVAHFGQDCFFRCSRKRSCSLQESASPG